MKFETVFPTSRMTKKGAPGGKEEERGWKGKKKKDKEFQK